MRWALLTFAAGSSLHCTTLLGVDFDERRGAEAGAPLAQYDAGLHDASDGSQSDSTFDTPCSGPMNLWTLPTKVDAACTQRKVFQLDTWRSNDDASMARWISIARKKSGALIVVYAGEVLIDEAFMRTLNFGDADPPTTPTKLTEPRYQGEFHGWGATLASDGDDIHLVYQINRDSAGGDVVYRKLGATEWSPMEHVGTAGPSSMSIAASPTTHDVMVSYFAPGVGTASGTLYTRLRSRATAAWESPRTVLQGFETVGVRGVGQSDLHFDGTGIAHIAYMRSQSSLSTRPEVGRLTSSVWSAGSSLDSALGIGGRAVHLGLVDTKVAAYFTQKIGRTKAELRLARWTLDGELPTISLLAEDIYEREHTTAQHSLDLATDAAGLVHIAYAVPQLQNMCAIYYVRESPLAGKAWLHDTIAMDIPCDDDNSPAVAMVVDPNGRPHIVYSYPGKGIFYATRYDR